jgi:hypothetical protein
MESVNEINVIHVLYPDLIQANKAIAAIRNTGVLSKDIGILTPQSPETTINCDTSNTTSNPHSMVEDVEEGAGVGAGVGLFLGIASTIVSIVVPGIGPLFAVGAIANAAIGTAAGAAIGTVSGSLLHYKDDMTRDEEAEFFDKGLRCGQTLVTIKVSNMNKDSVLSILREYGAIEPHKVT